MTTHDPGVAIGQMIPLRDIRVSKMNPRRNFSESRLAELTESVRQHGVLSPILVRPSGKGFELVAGERRYRAAKAAGLQEIPAVPRELDDTAVLEIQVVENLNRDDLHPLEEAEGYRRLIENARYDVARIAEKIGRSAAYVYDRLRLLQLVDSLKEMFLADQITAGHAVVLSRLKPTDQERAIKSEQALFEYEQTLWDPYKEHDDDLENEGAPAAPPPPAGGLMDRLKPRSVRELQAWVDKYVRFDSSAENVPQLFPETVAAVRSAQERTLPVVHITFEHQVPPDARDGTRTYGPLSWKRADTLQGARPCYHSALGVVVVGPRRGEAFPVCLAKKTCQIHWGSEMREAAKRRKAAAAGDTARMKKVAAAAEKKRLNDEAERKRFEAARPAILEAFREKVTSLPFKPDGPVTKLLLGSIDRPSASAMKALKTEHDLVVLMALDLLRHSMWSLGKTRDDGNRLGVDVDGIINRVAPAEPTPGKSGPKPRTAKVAPGKKLSAAPPNTQGKALIDDLEQRRAVEDAGAVTGGEHNG